MTTSLLKKIPINYLKVILALIVIFWLISFGEVFLQPKSDKTILGDLSKYLRNTETDVLVWHKSCVYFERWALHICSLHHEQGNDIFVVEFSMVILEPFQTLIVQIP